jgi:hypothetical protein
VHDCAVKALIDRAGRGSLGLSQGIDSAAFREHMTALLFPDCGCSILLDRSQSLRAEHYWREAGCDKGYSIGNSAGRVPNGRSLI